MKIIPVIDLKNNRVVHAKQGQRDEYQPVNSLLSPNADIHQVLEAFLNLYAFDTFYIADLNAITHQGDHNDLIRQLMSEFPELIFWVDQGYQSNNHTNNAPKNFLPVLGSECYQDNTLDELQNFKQRFILSLDYSATGPLGSNRLFADSTLWPEQIILMNLAYVGSHQGPNINQLQTFIQRYPNKQFIAAGGVRDSNDLRVLTDIGVNHALVASALHSGTIKREDIEKLQGKKIPL